MFTQLFAQYLLAKYFYLVFNSFYNAFWILILLWSLGKKLQNTFIQQVVSVLALCSAWCFMPNSLIQLFFKYLEDPDKYHIWLDIILIKKLY